VFVKPFQPFPLRRRDEIDHWAARPCMILHQPPEHATRAPLVSLRVAEKRKHAHHTTPVLIIDAPKEINMLCSKKNVPAKKIFSADVFGLPSNCL
jgi:hypothetical protein